MVESVYMDASGGVLFASMLTAHPISLHQKCAFSRHIKRVVELLLPASTIKQCNKVIILLLLLIHSSTAV
jgi:hypothetical protein